MQHIEHHDDHPALKGFALFVGLGAALGWTLLVVWVGLVGVADEIRKIQG